MLSDAFLRSMTLRLVTFIIADKDARPIAFMSHMWAGKLQLHAALPPPEVSLLYGHRL